jgi:hypothetical protein
VICGRFTVKKMGGDRGKSDFLRVLRLNHRKSPIEIPSLMRIAAQYRQAAGAAASMSRVAAGRDASLLLP